MLRLRPNSRICIFFLVVGLPIIFAGCNASRVTHFDHREFKPLFEVELPDTAWLAMDSCATGIHAIVELELDADPNIRPGEDRPFLHPSDAQSLTLTHGQAALVRAKYARLEGPVCLPVLEWFGARQIPVLADPTTACVYVYHAEFDLTSVPKENQDLILHYGGQEIALALHR